jgi:hypothetical protein
MQMNLKVVISGVLLAASMLPGTVYSGPLLKANGVSTDQDAQDYYKMIDPANERLTQADWRRVNGFGDAKNTTVIVDGHKNVSDLGFWRRIEMVIDKRPGYVGNVAMTTFNFEVGPNDPNPQGLTRCCNPVDAASIVNMEYSPGQTGDRITKFYIYNPENAARFGANAGKRKLATFYDPVVSRREDLSMPNGCASCHGGGHDFRVRGGDTGGGFIAFDFNVFSYVGSNTDRTLDDNEAKVKLLNQGVLMTNPDIPVKNLVRGLYGGRTLPRATQNSAYRPTSWATEPALWEVVVRDCQGCHTLSQEDVLDLNVWKKTARSIREVTFKERLMPNSPNGQDNFFGSSDWQIVDEALGRFGAP